MFEEIKKYYGFIGGGFIGWGLGSLFDFSAYINEKIWGLVFISVGIAIIYEKIVDIFKD